MGRPTKFDKDVADRICEALRLGSTWSLAALAGGVSPSVLRDWKARGRAGEEPFPAFLARLKEAEADATNEALRVIQKAAREGTWTAAAWLLERRYPKSYGRRTISAKVEMAPMSEEQARAKYKELVGHEWEARPNAGENT